MASVAEATRAGAEPLLPWPDRAHCLRFGLAAPGAERQPEGWYVRWTGVALMAIVNVTPDSFSDGGRFGGDPEAAVEAGLRAWGDGAAFVDVGGESSRPGAESVAESEELGRTLPVVEGLAARGVRVSIDTVKPGVARAALAAGACLVNDIRGLRDAAMRAVCAGAGAPAVVMHMQGSPRTMQRLPRYADVVAEVERELLARSRRALEDGVPSVVLDPGIGFGKTLAHNVRLVKATARLAGHGHPLLVGASRKGVIAGLAPEAALASPGGRLAGTLALHLYAAEHGAALLRVHDVVEHRQALEVAAALARGVRTEGAADG